MAEYIKREDAEEVVTHFMHSGGFSVADFIYAISKIPAADVRPVVRGEWEWEMYQYTPYCSICGGRGFPGPANGKKYNFCPNCGSDMREET